MSAFVPATSGTMVTGKLYRTRKGHAKRFVEMPPVVPEPVHRPARLAIMLAFAEISSRVVERA